MEITGRYLSFPEAVQSAQRMSEFWKERYQVTKQGTQFVVSRGFPPFENGKPHELCFDTGQEKTPNV